MSFVCLDGIDGGGKSTQAKLLYEYLIKDGFDCISTREPGGSPIADKIREVIINNKMDEVTEYLLFSAARREHMLTTIKPALEEGITVICDRFVDSSWVYQPNIPFNLREKVDREVTFDIMPDIVFILDIPAEIAMERSKARGKMNEFDNRSWEFFNNARNKYLQIAYQFDNYFIIDANRSMEEIQKEILDIMYQRV